MPVPSRPAVPGPESVDDLVQRIADRDPTAFGRFYRRLVRTVFDQVSADLRGPTHAVAVTRAVFVEVWRLAPLRGSRQLDGLAWVTAIAARRVADRRRTIDGPTARPDSGYDELLGHELAVLLGTERSAP